MKYVASISTNVKGEKQYDLAPCTLIIGKNGQGKSGIVDAVSLALTGRARSSGLGAKERDLMRLAPEGSSTLYATAVLDGGTVLKWSTEGTVQKAKRATWTSTSGEPLPAGMLAGDVASAVLLGSTQKLVNAILRATDGRITRSSILGKVPPNYHDLINLPEELPVGELLDLVETLDKEKRDLAAQVRAVEKSTGDAVVQPLSEDERALLDKLSKVFSRGTDAADVQALRDSWQSDIYDLHAQAHGEIGEESRVLWRMRADYIGTVMTACTLAKRLACQAHDSGTSYADMPCPVCNRKGVEPGMFDASIERVSSHFEKAREIAEALERVPEKEQGIANAQKVLLDLPAAVDRYRELRKRDSAASAGKVSRGSIPELTAKKDRIDSVLQSLRGVATEQVTRQSAVIEKAINRFLPKNMRARIDVGDKTCSISMRRGKEGSWHDFRALSGAERASLIAAFASATVSSAIEPVRLLVIDETWLDAASMKALMTSAVKEVSAGEGVTQAIVCVVEWGNRKIPDGWHVIRLDEKKGKGDRKDE